MTTHSKGKHTPGPWVITGPYGGDFFHYGIKHKSQFVDGGEHAEVRNLHTTKEAQATAKANAALIAAAPELLEACKEFVKWFDYLSEYQRQSLIVGQTLESASENWNNMDEPSPPIDKMQQAIAKASGE